MTEQYILKRTDTDQYYHSLTPLGYMLWVDSESQAQWFNWEELNKFIDRMNGQGNPKYDQFEKVLV
mgnify:CR=1 FL=1